SPGRGSSTSSRNALTEYCMQPAKIGRGRRPRAVAPPSTAEYMREARSTASEMMGENAQRSSAVSISEQICSIAPAKIARSAAFTASVDIGHLHEGGCATDDLGRRAAPEIQRGVGRADGRRSDDALSSREFGTPVLDAVGPPEVADSDIAER